MRGLSDETEAELDELAWQEYFAMGRAKGRKEGAIGAFLVLMAEEIRRRVAKASPAKKGTER